MIDLFLFTPGTLGFNLHHGTSRNPYSATLSRYPGGSSSGSAVVVASGYCVFWYWK